MKKIILLSFILLMGTNLSIKAQDSTKIKELEERVQKLEEKAQQSELQKLISEAEKISEQKKSTKKLKTFNSGQRSQQAINPEISVTGDQYLQYIADKRNYRPGERSGAYFRTLGLHMQSNLDPYSFAKVALEFSPNGFGFGEAYMTWANFLPKISLTVGKFRQQFGIVNRWHVHSLDQFDFPLALTTILGEEGLNQIGLSFDWLMPNITADENELTVQITNGQNEHLFSGNLFFFPSTLVHFKNYYDLNRNTYLEFGLTGMLGMNNLKGYVGDLHIYQPTRWTKLAGADLTLAWEPVNQALYEGFTWRSEVYYADKELLGNGHIKALGGYTYFEYKFSEQWQAGLRLDYTQPFEQFNSGKYLYQFVPYITWWQSHWVKLRLQYNYLNGNDIAQPANTLRLQLVWAAGPHKHERY